MLQGVHFLFSRGIPLCLPVSIANESEDNRIFAKAFLYLALHNNLILNTALFRE